MCGDEFYSLMLMPPALRIYGGKMKIPLSVLHQLKLIIFDLNNGDISDSLMLLLALQHVSQNLENSIDFSKLEEELWTQTPL